MSTGGEGNGKGPAGCALCCAAEGVGPRGVSQYIRAEIIREGALVCLRDATVTGYPIAMQLMLT